MDNATWKVVAKAQREATPQLTKRQCDRLTAIDRSMADGLEAHVDQCKGYSPWIAFASHALGKLVPSMRIKTTEVGGTRIVGAAEKTCNNPYLESEEYFGLLQKFQDGGKDGQPDWSADQRVYGAMAKTSGAFARTMGGTAILAGSAAISEAIPHDSLIERIGTGGLAGVGGMLIIGGFIDIVQGMRQERTEMRAANEARQGQ